MTQLPDYWTAHEELGHIFLGIDLDNVDLDTCRQVLDLASKHRELLTGIVAPMPVHVDPDTFIAADATAHLTIVITSVGMSASQLGDALLTHQLNEVGYAYSLTAMALYMLLNEARREVEFGYAPDES